jgi:hypothetical protein
MPLTVSAPLPLRVPVVCWRAVMELVPFRVRLPLIARLAAKVAVPEIVSGPVVSESGAPALRLAMVWLAAGRLPIAIVLVNVLAIQTLSVEIGTDPALQFFAVVH